MIHTLISLAFVHWDNYTSFPILRYGPFRHNRIAQFCQPFNSNIVCCLQHFCNDFTLSRGFPFHHTFQCFLNFCFRNSAARTLFFVNSVLLSHSFSSFNSFSIYTFQIPGILLPSITIFPFESFRQFTPSTSCLSFAICFAIRNTFLFPFSLSNSLATSFLLFSFASATALRALILASL